VSKEQKSTQSIQKSNTTTANPHNPTTKPFLKAKYPSFWTLFHQSTRQPNYLRQPNIPLLQRIQKKQKVKEHRRKTPKKKSLSEHISDNNNKRMETRATASKRK